jgi:hypothetical protein
LCCSSAKSDYEGKGKWFGRKAVTFVLFTVTGGVALSALDDLFIYHSCSRYVTLYLGVSFACKKRGVLLIKWLISILTWFALDILVKKCFFCEFFDFIFHKFNDTKTRKAYAIHMFSVYFYLPTPPPPPNLKSCAHEGGDIEYLKSGLGILLSHLARRGFC